MVKYIYNGVKLPFLPEVDGYDYKVLVEFNDAGTYVLYCMTGPLMRTGEVLYPNKLTAPYMSCTASVDGYGEFSQGTSDLKLAALYVPIWSNHDIYTADGTLYLAATDPIPVGKPITDPLSFAMGWQLGKRLRMRGRKPIGYLYGGVFIKGELPEYDEKAYPHMFIQGGDTPRLIVSERGLMYYPNAITPGFGWHDYESNVSTTVCETMILSINDGVCGEFASESIAIVGGTTQFDPVVWTSHEIQNSSDGTTYLEASDPIPVYE